MVLKDVDDYGNVRLKHLLMNDDLILRTDGHAFADHRIGTKLCCLFDAGKLLFNVGAFNFANDGFLAFLAIDHTSCGTRRLADDLVSFFSEDRGNQTGCCGLSSDTIHIYT